jgi:hypothetical protein
VAREAELILQALDRHLTAPGKIRLLGGAALTLAYGMPRSTEDVDLLQDDVEVQALIDGADFGEALAAANAELAPQGLYLSHIWGPEQLTLSPGWRERCRPTSVPGLLRLAVEVLSPADLVVSKLVRGDDGDLADIAWLLEGHVGAPEVRRALSTAEVPPLFAEVFPRAKARVEAMLAALPALGTP